jgi:hypothetical protein
LLEASDVAARPCQGPRANGGQAAYDRPKAAACSISGPSSLGELTRVPQPGRAFENAAPEHLCGLERIVLHRCRADQRLLDLRARVHDDRSVARSAREAVERRRARRRPSRRHDASTRPPSPKTTSAGARPCVCSGSKRTSLLSTYANAVWLDGTAFWNAVPNLACHLGIIVALPPQ